MIDWTSPEELRWFQSGMIWALVCCNARMYVCFYPEPLLERGKRELAGCRDAPFPGSAIYRASLTAWLEGVWAYIYHPRQGDLRLAALSGQIAYMERRREEDPLDIEGIVQVAGGQTQDEIAAYLRGVQAAADGRREEVFWEYRPRPKGYNSLLESLEAEQREPSLEEKAPRSTVGNEN